MATVYEAQNLLTGPGTMFAAPLGTTEPTAATGTWPAGWVALGYTNQGSTFTEKPTTATITPEEEYYPAKVLFTAYDAHLTVDLLELTVQNWQIALNQGVGSSALTNTVTTNSDGSATLALGSVGTEVPIMIGWDSYNEGSAASTGTPVGPVLGRLWFPQAINVGQIQLVHRKGANPQMLAADFQIIKKDASTPPFKILVPAALV